jgi:filamentous hemagglutinin
MFRKSIALLMGFEMLVSPALGLSATIPGFPAAVPLPSLATNTLPVASGTSWQGVQSITQAPGSNLLVVNQNQPQAIINWNSFNIGATAAVRFNQGTGTPGTATWKPDNSFVSLNRIYDGNPSLIYGSLSANGSVYLINRNGILFGPNSQVNVHGLVASALNITDVDFKQGLLRFTTDD